MLPIRTRIALFASFSISHVLAQNASCIAKQPPGYSTGSYGFSQPFLPYLVPNGTQSFDDSDSSGVITFHGQWTSVVNPQAVNSTLHVTNDTSASVSFTFKGSGIEWFGTSGPHQGIAKVTLNSNSSVNATVNAFSDETYEQQRLFSKFDLPVGTYKLTIQNTAGNGTGSSLAVDAFVVTKDAPFVAPGGRVSHADGWSLIQRGSSGVAAMQLSMISTTHAIIFDKTEHNLATVDGHPAWSVLYNINTDELQPVDLPTNSFCASGSFLSNGTLISIGGNRPAINDTSDVGYHDLDGRQSIRILEPCLGSSTEACHLLDMVNASPVIRWYPTVLRITDGSALIIGGSTENVFMNNHSINQPSTSFFPALPSTPIKFDFNFLNRTLQANLFPYAFSLPNKRAFVVANTESVFYNWGASPPVEEHSFALPNGIRVNYPMAGSAILLPLSKENNYTSRILVCGGSDAPDNLCDFQYSAEHAASAQCSRIDIKRDGSTDGWKLDDSLPDGGRVMPDSVLLPTGEVVFLNGAHKGYMGIGSAFDAVGGSNADDPALSPVVYSPEKPAGKRWQTLSVRSDIPRLYHSVASTTPNGDVMITGSNPNNDRSLFKFPTDYRVEWLKPPYFEAERPTFTGLPQIIGYDTTFTLDVQVSKGLDKSKVKVSLMDFGFSTHSMHANTRLVFLEAHFSGNRLSVTSPPDAGVYPPGPGYIFVVVDNIASVSQRTLIGDGKAPAPH